ncbi:hypothetical protein G7076_00185 [Sphingomonas sp. HDW15A]|uniref:hypothetical protein n=1 Tax=Sphingomonas sp. HDW15A TaxID=2714942 RepID=UPI00140B0B3D|nr:hypothetical protein [Sphingomonas sp. HDW15A]QIK95114.1 hypothetical protein G7076_00185 [Sphingomonas sp. HDW15A]
MFAIMMSSIAVASSVSALPDTSGMKKEPTRYCREVNNASSRLYAVKVCRTRAEWRRWEACHGSVTRYCTPKKKAIVETASLGRETAYPLNDDSRIICRDLKETGTRIIIHETCLPKREWDRMWSDTSEAVRKLQGDFSTRPPQEPRDFISPR